MGGYRCVCADEARSDEDDDEISLNRHVTAGRPKA